MNIKIEQKKAGEDLVNLIIVQNKRGFEVVFTDANDGIVFGFCFIK